MGESGGVGLGESMLVGHWMIALRMTRMISVLMKMETQREDSSDLTEGTRIGYGGVA